MRKEQSLGCKASMASQVIVPICYICLKNIYIIVYGMYRTKGNNGSQNFLVFRSSERNVLIISLLKGYNYVIIKILCDLYKPKYQIIQSNSSVRKAGV